MSVRESVHLLRVRKLRDRTVSLRGLTEADCRLVCSVLHQAADYGRLPSVELQDAVRRLAGAFSAAANFPGSIGDGDYVCGVGDASMLFQNVEDLAEVRS